MKEVYFVFGRQICCLPVFQERTASTANIMLCISNKITLCGSYLKTSIGNLFDMKFYKSVPDTVASCKWSNMTKTAMHEPSNFSKLNYNVAITYRTLKWCQTHIYLIHLRANNSFTLGKTLLHLWKGFNTVMWRGYYVCG